ncbi:MAG: peptidylprolyl isomerase [Candidatus Cloacimonetes bacterium]|nr:peptidylprolyl isomerase [Candidatus Cloacimonadota bacterium]
MRKLLYLLLIIILAVSGCKAKKDMDYIARVNDEVLTLEEFKASFGEAEWKKLDDRAKEKYIDEWVNLSLLSQECDRKGLSSSPVIQERIRISAKKIKANALIASELREIPSSEEEQFSYYQLHHTEYRKKSKEYNYQRILIKDKQKLEEVADKLRSGLKFKDMAKEYSEEAAGRKGGYMGFATENSISSDIWQALESLEQYRWKSLEYKGGFMILRWYEKRELDIEMPFSDVRDEICEKLSAQNRQDKFDRLKKELEDSSIIEKKFIFNGD